MKLKIYSIIFISSSLSAMQPTQLFRDVRQEIIQEHTNRAFQLLQKMNLTAQDKKDVLDFVREGVHVNAQDAAGYTLLYRAVMHNLDTVVTELLKENANPNIKNRIGGSPLAAAASANNAPLTQMLLQAKADPNLRLTNNSTALIIAVRNADAKNNKNRDTIQLLIEAKANLDLQNDNKETALNIAVINNNNEIVKKLLEAGADPNIEDAHGYSALLLAKKYPDLFDYIFEFKRQRRLKQMGKS